MARHGTEDGIPVHRVPWPGGSTRLRWILAFTCFPALIAKKREYDLLFVSSFRSIGLSALFASRLVRKPCVLKAESLGEMSGSCFSPGLRALGLKWSGPIVQAIVHMRNRMLVKADCFVAMSSEIAAEFRNNGVPPDRLVQIPNAVDTETFCPIAPGDKQAARLKLGLPEHCKLVLFAGRLVTYKGVMTLIHAWERIAPSHPDARLVMVGAGSEDVERCEDEVRQFVVDHKLEKSVIFTGEVNDVQRYYKVCDIFVFPSHYEAFGLVLIEAMACGLPIVSANVGGPQDVIEDGRNGLFVPPFDERELQSTLERLLGDEQLCRRLSEAGLSTIHKRFSKEVVAESYAELFKRLTGRGSGKR